MKKYIFPILLILVFLVSFIIIKQVKHQHNSTIKSYDKQLSDLKKNNQEYVNQNKNYQQLTVNLKTKYEQSKSLLDNQINQNRRLGNQIKNLVYSPDFSFTSKMGINVNQSDSLTNLAVQLVLSNSTVDSLCITQIDRLEKITQIQAEQIIFCDSNFRQSQLSLQSSIEKNKDDKLQNQVLQRKVKRNRFIAKLEGSILIVTASILTTFLLIP